MDAIIPISMRFVTAFAGTTNIGYVQVIEIDMLALNEIIKINNVYKVQDLSNYLGFMQDQPIQVVISRRLAEKINYELVQLFINGKYQLVDPQAIVDNTSVWGDDVVIVDIKNFQNIFTEYAEIDQLHLTFNSNRSQGVIKDHGFLPGEMIHQNL